MGGGGRPREPKGPTVTQRPPRRPREPREIREVGGKAKIGSQWVIDPKVFQERTFRTEYSNRIGETAPAFVFRKHMPPDKNKSNSHTDGAVPFPPAEQFASTYSKKMLLDGTAGQPGYEKTAAFKVKEVQIQLGVDKKLHVTVPSSHTMHPEPDMRAANARNLREDGIRSAGLPRTRLPYYNIVPGVGGDDPAQGRCVFDAYQDHTNKYRDSRRFAQMNNPRIPRNFSMNPLTGDVVPFKQAPPAELFPVNPVRPPLASLAQVRPPEVNAHKTVFETRPW